MKIIDAHLHCFPGEIPDYSRYGNDELVVGILMGACRESNGKPELPYTLPDRSVYCCGIHSSSITQENTPSLLKEFANTFADPRCVGLKFYCGYESVYPADPCHFPFLDLLMKCGKTLVIHTGETAGGHGLLRYSHPLAVDEIAKLYPDLNIVIAHYGNPWIVDATAVAARNPNVYIDLSGLIEGEFKAGDYLLKNRAYTNYIGMWMNYLVNYDKFLFGTDWPLVDPAEYADVIKSIVPESEHEKIFYTNALKVFRIPKDMLA